MKRIIEFLKNKNTRKYWPYFYMAVLGIFIVIKPSPWNTVYYEMGINKSNPDSNSMLNRPIIAHTYFEPSSWKYKKYIHGDTVPIFYKNEIVGGMKHSEMGVIWMKTNEIK